MDMMQNDTLSTLPYDITEQIEKYIIKPQNPILCNEIRNIPIKFYTMTFIRNEKIKIPIRSNKIPNFHLPMRLGKHHLINDFIYYINYVCNSSILLQNIQNQSNSNKLKYNKLKNIYCTIKYNYGSKNSNYRRNIAKNRNIIPSHR